MARRVAPPKNTSGSGFSFEDQVIAYLLSCLLAGESAFGVEWASNHEQLLRIDLQTRVAGWYLDDILITFSSGRHLALSLKSNGQITGKRLPDDFVSDAWEQYLGEGSQVFDINRDYLGLVTAPLSPQLNGGLHEMVRWARDQDVETFLARIDAPHGSSGVQRNLFNSLQCAQDLADRFNVTERDKVLLLRRLRFFSFDFQDEPSKDNAGSIRRCQALLLSGDYGEAKSLWERLIGIASQYRRSGGYLDLHRLLLALEERFKLKPWPQFALDFQAISRWTSEALANLPDKIGFSVTIPRVADVAKLGELCGGVNPVAITGPSGCGKSVLVKNWIGSLNRDIPVLWLDGRILARCNSLASLQQEISLTHSIEEVSAATTSTRAYCIIDGAGSVSSTPGYANVAALMRALQIGEETSPWRFLIVCQQEEWRRIYTEICHSFGKPVDWARFNVEVPQLAELDQVWREFPSMQPLIRQPKLGQLLLRPKILDLIASRIAMGLDVSTHGWVGESSVALWYWEAEIERPPAAVTRSQFVRRIAEQQADEILPSVSTDDFPAVIDDLVNDRVLSHWQGAISFQHDLFGDWARLQILISKRKEGLNEFIQSKIVSPFWNRAVRLYGLYLLEHDGHERWKAFLDSLDSDTMIGNLAQDLILESVVFAANPMPLLESLWTHLRADEGRLLRRLLGRFLYTATEANHQHIALAKTPFEELRKAAEERLPYWPFWLPMLVFLHAHRKEALCLAPQQVIEIANSWLRYAAGDWPQRQEAAEIAIVAAKDILFHEWDYGYVADETAELAYTAALAAAPELPDQVRDFVLQAAGRSPRQQKLRRTDLEAMPSQRQTVAPVMSRRPGNPEPWPHGPVQSANDEFQKIFFKTDAAFPLIAASPNVASEVILALLLPEPCEYRYDGGYMGSFKDRECELADDIGGHYPPFYWNFPWLYFIRTSPVQAISTIIKLVNFASDRWREVLERRHSNMPSIRFLDNEGVEHIWIGDSETYFWYTGIYGPHSVSSALMTLEFWLYEQMNVGGGIDRYISQILEESHSIALAGLLVSVACKHTDLLRSSLRFLMSVPEFLLLERQKQIDPFSQTAMIAWVGQGPSACQHALNWHTMPHRTLGLDVAARRLLLTDSSTRTYFKRIRKDWRKQRTLYRRAGQGEAVDSLERLISAFTPAHHSFEYDEVRNGVVIIHHLPEAIEERVKPERERAEARLRETMLPIECRRILLGEVSLAVEDEIETFWQKLQLICQMNGDHDNPEKSRADAVCGAAAVLLLKQRDWLSHYPNRKDWCREQILHTVENPPEHNGFDSEVDASDWNWHNFCADALPHLWAQNINSQRLRTCVSLMALDHHYITVAGLFRACHAERHLPEAQFTKLQALLRYWALEKIGLRRREDSLEGGFILRPEERRPFRVIMSTEGVGQTELISGGFRKIVEAFIDDTLPTSLSSLSGSSRNCYGRRCLRYAWLPVM